MCVNLQHSQPQNKWKWKFKWGKNQPLMATKLPNLQSTIIFGNHLLQPAWTQDIFNLQSQRFRACPPGNRCKFGRCAFIATFPPIAPTVSTIKGFKFQFSLMWWHYPAKPSGQNVGPKFYFRFCGLNKHAHPCSKDDVQYLLLFSCPTRVRQSWQFNWLAAFPELNVESFWKEGWQG